MKPSSKCTDRFGWMRDLSDDGWHVKLNYFNEGSYDTLNTHIPVGHVNLSRAHANFFSRKVVWAILIVFYSRNYGGCLFYYV